MCEIAGWWRACLCGHICMTGPLSNPGVKTKAISVAFECKSCCYKACCTEQPLVRGSGSKREGGRV